MPNAEQLLHQTEAAIGDFCKNNVLKFCNIQGKTSV